MKISLLGLVCLIVAACQPYGEEPPVADEKAPVTADVPDGAIKVTDTLYMVPVSIDDDGCQQYSAHAVDALAPTVIYYRRADGSFTPKKGEAAC